MKRVRITALAPAVALPFTVVQAIEELINEYRAANGLHPLVTHEL